MFPDLICLAGFSLLLLWRGPQHGGRSWHWWIAAALVLSAFGVLRDVPLLMPLELGLVLVLLPKAVAFNREKHRLRALACLGVFAGVTGYGRFLEFYNMDTRRLVPTLERQDGVRLLRTHTGTPVDEGVHALHFAMDNCQGNGVFLGGTNRVILELRSKGNGAALARHTPADGRSGSIVALDCGQDLVFYTDFWARTLHAAQASDLKHLWVSADTGERLTYIMPDTRNKRIYLNQEFAHKVMAVDYGTWEPSLFTLQMKAQGVAVDPAGKWLYTLWKRSIHQYGLKGLKKRRSMPLYQGLQGGDVMAILMAARMPATRKGGKMRTVLHTVQSSPGVVRLFDGETLRPLWSKRVGWGVRYGWLDGVNGAYVVCNFFTGRVTVLDAWTGEVRRKLWGSPRCRLPWPSRDGKDLYWATKSGVLVFERRVFR